MWKWVLCALVALITAGLTARLLLKEPGDIAVPMSHPERGALLKRAERKAGTVVTRGPHLPDKQDAAEELDASASIPDTPEEDVSEHGAEDIRARLLGQRVEARRAEIQRERVAQGRFNQALVDTGITAAAIDPSVRDLFHHMELKSILDDEGMLLALEIEFLDPDSPLVPLGFLPGDRIKRINDTTLRDAADLPQLMVSLGDTVHLCAERNGDEICGEARLQ